MALHDNLKDARSRTGMSQELVAEQLGVSRQAVTKWERGQSKPSAANLKALADLYQIPSEELLADIPQKGPDLILRANLTRIAIAAQTVFLYSCTQVIVQYRHCSDADRSLYLGEFVFFLVLLTLSSIWATTNHRYEPDKNQRRKNLKMESIYCCIQAFVAVLTIFFEKVLVGAVLLIIIYAVYILYVNPRFMNRKLTK